VTKQDLVISHIFDAPVEEVWRAWHDPELIKQWWGPDGFTCPQAVINFREGGVSLVCMRAPREYGGKDSYSTWTYTAVELNKRIEFIHNLADSNGNKVAPVSVGMPVDFPQDQRQEVVFKDLDGKGCELTITEYDWPVGQMMKFSEMGMEQCLKKMADALAKVKGEMN
jgi:uncharacterized protein YndB with AHSA1/START domain